MNKSKIAILNGKLFLENRFIRGNVIIEGKKIKKIIPGLLKGYDLSKHYVIDATDCYVSYGFIDPHVHFRCPGEEHKEDWKTGPEAAIKGGFTYVMDMPNNKPPAVDFEILHQKNELAKTSPINYGFYIGLTDKNADHIKHIYKQCLQNNIPIHGVKAFIGSSTGDLLVKKAASLTESMDTTLLHLFHCEDEETLKNFENIPYQSVHDHEKRRPVIAEIMGLKKIFKAAKSIKTHAKIYICHVSSENVIRYINKFRKRGFNIIAEITPHHLYFYLEDLKDNNIYKVNPPIRSLSNAMFLRKCFNKGYFQVVGTDHAPHLYQEKQSDQPPSGFPGLETCFYALYSLYKQKILSLKKIFQYLTSGYEIFNIKKRGLLEKGYFADITIIRKEPHIFRTENSATKADFSPFDNLETHSFIDTVIINGKICLRNGEFIQ
ncbi:MAG: dihydroorotase family protein [Spirochaetes bacterium]|nr:dihydroorotase family protein [Spirochaetota bacterium]